jgi:HNH endonuclease
MSRPPANDDRVAAEGGPRKISLDERLQALEPIARLIEWPFPRIRDQRTCWELSRIVDGVLTNVARGHAALELAIGESLEALAVGDRVFEVGGYCNVPDYARERHGIPASTAVKLMRFSRDLRKRPLLRAAVREGNVSISQAEAVLPVAVGDGERLWVARASNWTVRRLVEEVKKSRASPREPGDAETVAEESSDEEALPAARGLYDREERWRRLVFDLPPGGQEIIDEGNALAQEAMEHPGAPTWQCIRAVLDEYFGSRLAVAHEFEVASMRRHDERTAGVGSFKVLGESLDEQCAYWAALVQVPYIEAPEDDARLMRDPQVIDQTLQRHVKSLRRWDVLFGHLALLSQRMRCWWIAGFASFEHYCVERLGMALRTVEQRIALEERLHELPSLRAGMESGSVSYEQARIIAAHADRASVEVRIEQARRMTCIAFRRRVEADERAQMSARRKFKAVVPQSVVEDLWAAFHALREQSETPVSRGECLVALYAHFIAVWKPLLARRRTLHRRVLERDGYRCQVPGCSRTASHAHHIELRSQGGKDEMSNLTSLCVAHHLRGVHKGRIRVAGNAPDQLVWSVNGALPEIEGRWCEQRPCLGTASTCTSGASSSRHRSFGVC